VAHTGAFPIFYNTKQNRETKQRHVNNENGNTLAMLAKIQTIPTNVLLSEVYISTLQMDKLAYNTYTLQTNNIFPDA
jgi:hypothetical protein